MFNTQVYSARRAALRAKLNSGIVLLPANSESPANYPANGFRFRQDSTFLYFFGINHPDYIGLLDLDSGEELLYGEEYTMDDIIWMGRQPSVQMQAEQVGVTQSGTLHQLNERLQKVLAEGRTIHFLPPYRADRTLLLSHLLGIPHERIKSSASVALAVAVVSLREIKEACEIAQIEEACAIGYRMHTTAMRLCRPGVSEREIAGAIEGIALSEGAGVSFHSIVSQNGETLHNHSHDNHLTAGKLLLVDAGAESTMNYCSDFTRTIPVSGRFTTKQKEIYDLVLAANTKAFSLATPGMCYQEVHLASARVLIEGLKALGLMQGDTDAAVACGAQALFMPHGLGHQLGLDVHDMEDIGEKYVGYDEQTLRSSTPGLSSLRMGKRLKAGMVMTVEPGLYFIPALIAQWEKEGTCAPFINFARAKEYLDFGGIRIEDDLLITKTGNRMLGAHRPPATTSDVEREMSKG